MTVEQFDPKQTTTLDTPKKVLEEQAVEVQQAKSASNTAQNSTERAAKVGFVSLGWLK